MKSYPPNVIVVGDAALDVSVLTTGYRATQEDPGVMVLSDGSGAETKYHPGCAANLAANLAAMGCRTTLCCPWADDADGRQLATVLDQYGVELMPWGELDRTTVKTRYYANGRLVGRVDRDGVTTKVLPPKTRVRVDAVVLTDYGKGAIPDGEFAAKWLEVSPLSFADPKLGRTEIWRHVPVKVLVMNQSEAEEFCRGRWEEKDGETRKALPSSVVLSSMADQAVVKFGIHGSAWVYKWTHRAAVNHRKTTIVPIEPVLPAQVYDVQGAGDTYLAGLVAASLRAPRLPFRNVDLIRNVDLSDACTACMYASTAAGVAVGRPGTVVVGASDVSRALPPQKLLHILAGLGGLGGGMYHDHIRVVRISRIIGWTVGYTSGCFDVRLHKGHRHLLQEAAKACDVLIVGVDSDDRVRKLKGPHRPILSQDERLRMVAQFPGVTHTFINSSDQSDVLRTMNPDVVFKGGSDYPTTGLPEIDASGWEGAYVHCGLVECESTTQLIARLKGTPDVAVHATEVV